jgi:acyl carrier protein
MARGLKSPRQSSHTARERAPGGADYEAQRLFKVIQKQLSESGLTVDRIRLDSSITRDLGIDSLGRVELISRVERVFDVALPERVYANAETPRDLLQAIHSASGIKPAVRPEISAIEMGEAESAPGNAGTLVDVLLWHVNHHPDRPHIHIYNHEPQIQAITYKQLAANAADVAAGLQNLGVEPGEPVSIMLPTSDSYFYSFYGVLFAGGIPVPLYPPANPAQLEDHMRRHVAILQNSLANVLITVPEAEKIAYLLKSQVESLKHVVTVKDLLNHGHKYTQTQAGPESTAFIQYTSGSTGTPKGVVLTHQNLLANLRAMGKTVQAGPQDVFVSWLPLYHDMGLIGAWLGSVYFAYLLVVMSPLNFLRRPERWLRAIHQYKGTMSASPNFGYELCIRKLTEEHLEGLDLSSLRAAFNGAEAVSPDTVERFYEKFKYYGLKREALMPVYGLAENSLGLTFPPLGRGPRIDRVQREAFMQRGEAIQAEKKDQSALRFISCGRPLANHEIRIVDNANRELPERREGRLQFYGPSATSGYFRNPSDTKRLFQDQWLDSGDMAYIDDGELFITGRVKDIIIRAGRNIYPHEIEEAVGDIEGIRAGRVTAFGSISRDTGTERLVIVAESYETDEKTQRRLRAKVNSVVNGLAGTPPDDVVIAPPNTILKTSSGKLRRAASREIYEKGRVGKRRKPVWWQIMHFMVKGIAVQLHKTGIQAANLLFGFFGRSLFWILAPLTWIAVVLSPAAHWRWWVMRHAVGTLAKLTGTKIRVYNRKNLLPENQTCIYVANHASYLDALAIIYAIGRQVSFVAKAELGRQRLSKTFLNRISAAYVERFDVEKGVKDTDILLQHAQQGESLFFFPEGTFTRKPGLLPFRMGAFITAARAGLPVVPVTIRGTRSILRAGRWLPNRGNVQVYISKPIQTRQLAGSVPGGDAWDVAKVLRQRCREEILRHTGEPDLSAASTRFDKKPR